jgi:hypothetical protein
VLRVVLGSDPSSSSSSRVLRPFNNVCSEGHAAALRTIRHLHLDRAAELGVPLQRQLAVLAAADHATALTLHSSQVEGLVACLLQQLERQSAQQELLMGQGVLQLSLGDADNTPPTGNATNSSTCHHSNHPSHALTTPTSTSTSSSSSSRASGAAASHPITLPAAKPRGPYFKQLTVTGPVTAATIQHLEQLLDLLPGTQTLEEVVLWGESDPALVGYYRAVLSCLTEQEPIGYVGRLMAAEMSAPEPRPCTTHTTIASSGSSSSWRSSCHTLAAVLRYDAGEDPGHTPLDVSHLQPLLGPQQTLFLVGVSAAGLPQCTASLKDLQALHTIAATSCGPEVLAAAAQLTNLHHLGITANDHPMNALPAAFSGLVHLTSIDFTGQRVSGEALEVVCSIPRLQYLNLTYTEGSTTLPASISRLVNLEALWMDNTEVCSLPETMTALTALRMLSWNLLAPTAPLELGVVWRMKRLRIVSLLDYYLSTVPEAISQMTSLEVLDVTALLLRALPNAVSALVNLRALRVDAPALRYLPEGITALSSLQYVSAPSVVPQEQSSAVMAFLEGRKAQGCTLKLAPAGAGSSR